MQQISTADLEQTCRAAAAHSPPNTSDAHGEKRLPEGRNKTFSAIPVPPCRLMGAKILPETPSRPTTAPFGWKASKDCRPGRILKRLAACDRV